MISPSSINLSGSGKGPFKYFIIMEGVYSTVGKYGQYGSKWYRALSDVFCLVAKWLMQHITLKNQLDTSIFCKIQKVGFIRLQTFVSLLLLQRTTIEIVQCLCISEILGEITQGLAPRWLRFKCNSQYRVVLSLK